MSETMKCAHHCHITIANAEVLPKGKAMVSHLEIVEPWEHGPAHEGPSRRYRNISLILYNNYTREAEGGGPA